MLKANFHFLTIFLIGCSATFWAVYEIKFIMPLVWLIFLSIWILFSTPAEFKMFFRRFAQIGLLLLIISVVQIIFRREGEVMLSLKGFPLVFSNGFREAMLLWIRFMIIFELANIFAQVSLFEFLLFLNKIRFSIRLSLLLLTALKFIPFMFNEAKKGLWVMRFRGIDIRKLNIKGKYIAFRKLLMPLLFRGIHYASLSSLALELRGYGAVEYVKISQAYPLKAHDYCILTVILIINFVGIFVL